MKEIINYMLFAFVANAHGQEPLKSAKMPADFVPDGYVVYSEIQGDLNKDNQADYVLVVKGAEKNNYIKDEYRGELDRNRRGVIIAIKNGDHYDLVLENRACFSSENEDGGVYYAPELYISIEKGVLVFHYNHGRYGYWSYKFQYRNQDIELIGYDSSQSHGPVVEKETSINFLTRKAKIRVNTNQYAESGGERFKETWRSFTLDRPISLKDISDFDYFDVKSKFIPIE